MYIKEFKVLPDQETLYIHVKVPDLPGYDNMTISRVVVQDHEHFSAVPPEEEQLVIPVIDNKEVMATIKIKDSTSTMRMTGGYFLYVLVDGVPGPEIDCPKDFHIQMAINLYPIFNIALKLFKQLTRECDTKEIKSQLIDINWKKEALLQALYLKEFPIAIDIYNDLLLMDIDKGNCLNACGNKTNRPQVSWGCKTC